MRRLHFFTGVLTGLLLAVAFQMAIAYWHRPSAAAARFTTPITAPQPAAAQFIIEDVLPHPFTDRAAPPSWTPRWFNGQKYYIVPLS